MKKIISLALVLALCLSLLPVTVFAEEESSTWDGNIATAFDGGDGTADNPYQIATGAQLAYLAKFVNSDIKNDCAGEYFTDC